MRRIACLSPVILAAFALSLPLASTPSGFGPKLVLTPFRFVPGVSKDCSDPVLKTICEDAEQNLSVLKEQVQSGVGSLHAAEYTFRVSDRDFEAEERQLKDEWRTRDRGAKSLRPYIIEAKVTRTAADEYNIAFHGRLVGDSDWLPSRTHYVKQCTMVELRRKHFEEARKALIDFCLDVVQDWNRNNNGN